MRLFLFKREWISFWEDSVTPDLIRGPQFVRFVGRFRMETHRVFWTVDPRFCGDDKKGVKFINLLNSLTTFPFHVKCSKL